MPSALVTRQKMFLYFKSCIYSYYFNLHFIVYAEATIQCKCLQGYNGNGIGANGCIKDDRIALDPCQNNPCGFHGVCLENSTHSFSCQCETGYTGT